MQGMVESEFWATFVQCLQCNQVTFREHFAINHKCSTDPATGKEPSRPKARHHPYDRTRPRILARTETLLADVPEYQTIRSMPALRSRDSTPGSAHNYDPDDVISLDQDALTSSPTHDGYQSAEEGGRSEDDLDENTSEEIGSGEGDDLWWQHDVPELSSDGDLPSILTILDQAFSEEH